VWCAKHIRYRSRGLLSQLHTQKKCHGQLLHQRKGQLLRRGITLSPSIVHDVSGRIHKRAPRQSPMLLWQNPDGCLVVMIHSDSRCATCSQQKGGYGFLQQSKLTSHDHGRNRRDLSDPSFTHAHLCAATADAQRPEQSDTSYLSSWVHRSLGLVDLAFFCHDRAIRCFALVLRLLCFTRTPCRTVSHCCLTHGSQSCPLAQVCSAARACPRVVGLGFVANRSLLRGACPWNSAFRGYSSDKVSSDLAHQRR
jgi:hypothetical protein